MPGLPCGTRVALDEALGVEPRLFAAHGGAFPTASGTWVLSARSRCPACRRRTTMRGVQGVKPDGYQPRLVGESLADPLLSLWRVVILPVTKTATIETAPVQMMEAPWVASPRSIACQAITVRQPSARSP